MEREAGLARNSNKKLAHDMRRARQRAKREQEIHLGVLPIKHGRVLDVTPHVASWNIATDGGYLMLGEGFTIVEKDERASYMDKVREYRAHSKEEVAYE